MRGGWQGVVGRHEIVFSLLYVWILFSCIMREQIKHNVRADTCINIFYREVDFLLPVDCYIRMSMLLLFLAAVEVEHAGGP